jgi:hypothetical protein
MNRFMAAAASHFFGQRRLLWFAEGVERRLTNGQIGERAVAGNVCVLVQSKGEGHVSRLQNGDIVQAHFESRTPGGEGELFQLSRG